MWIIVILLVAQVLVILGQDILGPSFFLPKDVGFSFSRLFGATINLSQWVTVSAYNYHPPLPTSDTEAPKQSLGDCAICMEPIIVQHETSEPAKGSSAQLLSSATTSMRKAYAWAPCHHVFVSGVNVLF